MSSNHQQHEASPPDSRLQRLLRRVFGAHTRRAALALPDQVIVGGMNFLTLLLIGRLAGAEELGVFALAITVFYFVLAMHESLITTPYTIFAARLRGRRKRAYAGSVLCQNFVVSLVFVVGAIIVAAALAWAGGRGAAAAIAFAVAVPLCLLRELARRIAYAEHRMIEALVLGVVGAVGQLLAMLALVFWHRLDAASGFLAMGVSAGLAGMGWLWLRRRDFRWQPQRLVSDTLQNWRLGRWIMLGQSTTIVNSYASAWLLAGFVSVAAAGAMVACESILRLANPLIVALSNVITPRAAHAFAQGGTAELHRITLKATLVLTLALALFSAVLLVAGDSLLHLVYGDQFAGMGLTLGLLAIGQLLAKAALAPGRALLVLERLDLDWKAQLAGCFATLGLSLALVPSLGVLGAALGLLGGNTVMATITIGAYFWLIRHAVAELPSPVAALHAEEKLCAKGASS